jgi:ubiquinone/menaquinone biosynthesis C-methylase UbiE
MQSKMSGDNYNEGYWEHGVGSNYHSYGFDPGWPVVASVVRDYFDAGSVAYEVACAKGYLVKSLVAFGLNAYGIDISDYAISKAEPDVSSRLVVGNAVSLPWEDKTADIVLSMEFFEHVPEDEVDTVLSEKIRVLKPGGVLAMKIGIVIPTDHPFAGQDDHDVTHYTVKDRAWWETKFSQAGLIHDKEFQDKFDYAFANRDWVGRFFAWRVPNGA